MTCYNLNTLPADKKIFIFDANVLIYLHGIDPDPLWTRKYSEVAEKLISHDCKILLDSVILGEFINRYINSSLQKRLGDGDVRFSKKKHRNSPEYNAILKELSTLLTQIEKTYKIDWVVDGYDFIKDLTSLDFVKQFNTTEFNDYILTRLAKKKNAIVVTNDNDFKSVDDIDILKA